MDFKNFTIKDFVNLSDSERKNVYNNAFLFLRMIQNSLNQGIIDDSQLSQLLSDAGFSKNGNNWYRNSRSDFSTWLQEKFGPFIKTLGEFGVGYGLLRELQQGISNNSDSSASSQSSADAQAINAYNQAGANIGGSDSSNIFSSILSSLSGIGSSFSSSLAGLGLQLGSSWLNMQNMEKLIDKQNAYNTPAAQMQRFSDAGLNPNLIYGLGSNGNQPASGSVAPVDFDTSQRENRLAKMQIETQMKIADADVMAKTAQAKLSSRQADNMAIQNEYDSATLQDRIAQVSTNLELTSKQVAQKAFEVDNQQEAFESLMALQAAQTYAGYYSSHSIFGKVAKEAKDLIDAAKDYIKEHYPAVYRRWENSVQSIRSDFNSAYE